MDYRIGGIWGNKMFLPATADEGEVIRTKGIYKGSGRSPGYPQHLIESIEEFLSKEGLSFNRLEGVILHGGLL